MSEFQSLPPGPNTRPILHLVRPDRMLGDTISPEHREYLDIEYNRQKVYNSAVTENLPPNTYVPMADPEGRIRPYDNVFADIYLLIGETPPSDKISLKGLYRDHATTSAVLEIATEMNRPTSTTKIDLQRAFLNDPYLTDHDFHALSSTAERHLPGANLPGNTPLSLVRESAVETLTPTLRTFTADFAQTLRSFEVDPENEMSRMLRRDACYTIAVQHTMPEIDIAAGTALDQLGIDIDDYREALSTLYNAYTSQNTARR